jgi:hypothetical protein
MGHSGEHPKLKCWAQVAALRGFSVSATKKGCLGLRRSAPNGTGDLRCSGHLALSVLSD